MAANRAQFYWDVAAGPFYNFNKPGVKTMEPVVWNWWRQGMMGGAKAHYDGIVAFSQTDFTEDLKTINVPVLVMHSEDDQIVPYVAAGPLSAKLLKHSTLKSYKGFPHGMPTTHADDDQRGSAGVHQELRRESRCSIRTLGRHSALPRNSYGGISALSGALRGWPAQSPVPARRRP